MIFLSKERGKKRRSSVECFTKKKKDALKLSQRSKKVRKSVGRGNFT